MNMDFIPIKGNVQPIEEEFEEILQNHDIKHLYELALLVQMGAKLAGTKLVNSFFKAVGHVHAARWVTTASNLLVLYMQEMSPSKELVLLVEYILNVYTPAMLDIKQTWQCTNGTRHAFNILQLSRDLLEKDHEDVYQVVCNCIEENGFYLHPENVLLSMVTDSDEEVRNEGIQVIEKLRSQDDVRREKGVGLAKLRTFRKPKNIDFSAKQYHKMIDFNDFGPDDVCSPPILRDYGIDDIKNRNFKDSFLKVPSHRYVIY